jgi:hypothetical protein
MGDSKSIRIGVLALQGSFREHMTLLNRIPGVEAVEVRTKEELESCAGLIIPGERPRRCRARMGNTLPPPPPARTCCASCLTWASPCCPAGGESTTMALVAERWGLIPQLQQFAAQKRPIWGTCAGLIFLASRASGASAAAAVPLPCCVPTNPTKQDRLWGQAAAAAAASFSSSLGRRFVWGLRECGLQYAGLSPPAPAARRHEGGRAGAAGRAGLHGAPQLLRRPDQLV